MSAGIWIESRPGQNAILERDDCGTIAGRLRDDCERWLMLYDLAGPELANGARLIDQALCLSRNFDQEV
jgi:hypothetical protein